MDNPNEIEPAIMALIVKSRNEVSQDVDQAMARFRGRVRRMDLDAFDYWVNVLVEQGMLFGQAQLAVRLLIAEGWKAPEPHG